MTDDDLALVLFIATHNAQHGYPPTLREIATARGLPVSTVAKRVSRLIDTGFLSRKARRANRTLSLVASSAAPERAS